MPERPDSDREVLTSLPRSRPARRSAKRGDRATPDAAARASPKPPAPRKPRAAKAAPKSAAEAQQQSAGAAPTGKVRPNGERPRTPRERKIPAAGYAAPDGRGGERTASPAAELVSTSVQAAAELAQIGLTVGRQTLQSMLERLPKP